MSGPYKKDNENAAWRKNQANKAQWDLHEAMDPKSAPSLYGSEVMAHPGVTITQAGSPMDGERKIDDFS